MTGRRRDPYAILGVRRGASRDEIARAYRALAKRAHPDVGGETSAAMQDLNWAWQMLANPRRRAAWDRAHGGVPSAGHWDTTATPPRPDVRPSYEGFAGQPAWTVSGEPWAGAGEPETRRRASLGCIGLVLILVLMCGFVLVAALTPNLPRSPDQVSASAQASVAP